MASYSAIPPREPDLRPSTPKIRRPRRRRDTGAFAGQASFISSVINLVNTIVGAGVLAMPRAMSQMGILLGTSVIIWSGIMAGFGLYLQTRCAQYLDRGHASFFALSQLTYPNMAIVFDAAIAIKCFGVGVSYLIIIGDLMPGVVLGFNPAAGEAGYLVDRHFWITAFMLVCIPFSFLRRLDSLKYTSVIALVAIGYLVILVLYHFIKGDTLPDRGEVRYLRWNGLTATLANLPVIVFAYTCHQNMFSILNEIKNNSHFRTTGVVIASIGTACSTYILVAITGYLSYGSNVKGNIVAMYPPAPPSTIGRLAIVILVTFSYPLQVHPCRASIDAVLNWRPQRAKPTNPTLHATSSTSALLSDNAPADAVSATPSPHGHKNEVLSDARFAALTSLVVVASYLVAMTVSSLSAVLAYVGATGSTSISFILPGLFYYRISAPDSPARRKLRKDRDPVSARGRESDDEDGEDEDDDEDEGGYRSDDSDDEGRRDGWVPVLTGAGDRLEEVRRRLRAVGRGARRRWRRVKPKGLLRKASLALAVYGMVVMVVCLVTNMLVHAGGGEH